MTGLYYIFTVSRWYGRILSPYTEFDAWGAHFLLACFGQASHLLGPTIWSDRYSVTILPACSASEFIAFFCAAVIVFPVGWPARAAGLALGFAGIGLLNEIRVASVFWTGDHFGKIADILHEDIWPPILVFGIILFYAIWVRWTLKAASQPGDKVILRFSRRLILAYLLLLPPWPVLSDAYGAFIKSLGETAFGGVTERRELSFETPTDSDNTLPPRAFLPTRAVIVNRVLMASDGSGPVRNLDFSAWTVGWAPTILVVALIFATPVSWPRRWRAFLIGFTLIHVLVLIALRVCIWTESAEIGLVKFTPLWKDFANGLRMAVLEQLSFTGPVLVWIVATLRREDAIAIPGIFARTVTSGPPGSERGAGMNILPHQT